MANNNSIQYIDLGNNVKHPLDATTFDGKLPSAFQESNLVTSLDSSSDDDHYPSTKCVYEIIYGPLPIEEVPEEEGN